MLTEQNLFILIIAIFFTWLFLKHVLETTHDLINYSETSVRIFIGYLLLFLFFLLNQMLIIHFLMDLKSMFDQNIFVLIIFGYIVILIGSLWFCFRQPLGVEKVTNVDEKYKEWLKQNVKKLSEDIGLLKPPEIIISSQDNQSPMVKTIALSRNPVIIFPQNFKDYVNGRVAETIDLGQSNKKSLYFEALKDFIILHELSHIKNKDVLFSEYSKSFFNASFFWAIIASSAKLISPLYGFERGFEDFIFLLVISLITLVTLKIASFSFHRKRELLADARAMIFLSYEKTKILFGKGQLLKRLFIYINEFDFGGISFFSSSFAFKGKNSFFSLHPSYQDRIEAIEKKNYLRQKNPAPDKEAIIFVGIFNVLLTLIMVEIIPFVSFIELTVPNNVICVMFAAFLSSIALSIPLKHVYGYAADFSIYLKQYVFSFVGFIVVSTVGFIIVTPFIPLAPPVMAYVVVSLLANSILLVIMSILIISAVHSGTILDKDSVGKFFLHIVVVFGLFGLITFLLKSIVGIDMFTYGFGMCFSILICNHIFISNKTQFSYDIQFFSLHLFQKTIYFEFKSKIPYINKVSYFFSMCVAFIAIMFIGIIIYFVFLPISGQVESPILKDAIMIIFLMFLFVRSHENYLRKKFNLRFYKNVFNLSILLKNDLIKRNINCIVNGRDIIKSENGKYTIHVTAFLQNHSDFNFSTLLCVLKLLNYDDNERIINKETLFKQIIRYYSNQGGFALKEKGEPRLLNTFYALCIAKELCMLDRLNLDAIGSWIVSCQNKKEGYFKTPFLNSCQIIETYAAIKSLKLLDKEIHCIDSCVLWLYKKWRQLQTIETTFYFVESLIELGMLKEKYTYMITREILEPYEQKVKMWRYDKDAELIYHYFHVAKTLYGEQSEKYLNIISNAKEEMENTMENLFSQNTTTITKISP